MSDLIRKKDTIIALLGKGQQSKRYKIGETWELNFDEIRDAINNMPTSDAVEVVRCKDCKWYEYMQDVCHNPRYGDGHANYCPPLVAADYFCKDGERMEP